MSVFTANAAIGVSVQIFILVIVFVASVFSGMAVLVARFTGSNDPESVNRVVYQAFLTAVFMAVGILAPVGYFFSPWLLEMVNASPEVQLEALPFLRINFVFSIGMLVFFMMSGALRSAGDARTPLRLGFMMTIVNILLNVILIRGFGPIPAFGTVGAAMGTAMASGATAIGFMWLLFSGRLVIRFSMRMSFRPDFRIIRELFKFGLPTGFQGIVMNLAGVFSTSIHRRTSVQCGGPGSIFYWLHSTLCSDYVDICWTDGRYVCGGGPEPRCGLSGPEVNERPRWRP